MILPLLACLTLIGASSAPLVMSSLPFDNEPAPRCLNFSEDDLMLDLTPEEVSSWHFPNLGNFLYEFYTNDSASASTVFATTQIDVEIQDDWVTFEYAGYEHGVLIYNHNDDSIGFTIVGDLPSSYVFSLDLSDSYLNLSWLLGSGYPNSSAVVSAVNADIALNNPINGGDVVGEIVAILAGGLTTFGSSIGGSIASVAQSLAFTDGHLSIYFVLVIVFAGVALAIGLTTLLFNWLTNLGK